LVEFQKQNHIKLIPALVVQSIFRISHQHIKRFTSHNVLKKTGYADFDDSDDNTAARAKLEDEGARQAREKLLAGFATLFLVTNLYGILREYCYPSSKLRQSLPMNALFRLTADYTTRHASVKMFKLDLDNMTQDLDLPGTAPPDCRSAVLDLTNDDPPRHLDTAANTANRLSSQGG
jgi:hypothetical protein